jgi:NADH:ubiquinone oxidoreductase subunit 6 (subunit J)
MVTSVIFYLIAALIIFTALKMILSTNLVHSTLFMAATFFGIAMIYVLLNADYLAIVQIMVYVGAISILFIFGVMLTKRSSMEESNQFNKYKTSSLIVVAALFLVFAITIFGIEFTPSDVAGVDSSINAISSLLLNDYSIAFEISGVSLLLSTIGAIAIGKGVKEEK